MSHSSVTPVRLPARHHWKNTENSRASDLPRTRYFRRSRDKPEGSKISPLNCGPFLLFIFFSLASKRKPSQLAAAEGGPNQQVLVTFLSQGRRTQYLRSLLHHTGHETFASLNPSLLSRSRLVSGWGGILLASSPHESG